MNQKLFKKLSRFCVAALIFAVTAAAVPAPAFTSLTGNGSIGGELASATGSNAVVVGGYKSTAERGNSVAIGGVNTKANELASVAIGGGIAQGAFSTAIGNYVTATTQNEVAIGSSNTNKLTFSGFNSGSNITATDGSTFILGNTKITSRDVNSNKLIAGSQNQATNDYTSAIGGSVNTASGNAAAILGGYQNKATANHSTALGGTGSTASGNFSTAIGGGIAQGANTVAIGSGVTTSTTQYETAIGSSNTNKLTFSGSTIAFTGSSITAPARSVFSIGTTTKISDTVLAYGQNSSAAGGYSAAIGGLNATAAANVSVAIGGQNASASGNYSTAIGGGKAQGSDTVAIGSGVQTTMTQYETAIGSSNSNKLTFSGSTIAFTGTSITAPSRSTFSIGSTTKISDVSLTYGNGSSTKGGYAAAIGGLSASANGNFDVVIGGSGGSANGRYSVSIGGGQTGYMYTVAIGSGVTANTANYETAIGSSNTNKLTFLGTNITATNGSTFILGSTKITSRDVNSNKLIAGYRNSATGDYSSAIGGSDVKASGSASTAIGGQNGTASGNYSTAIAGGTAQGANSVAIGNGVTTSTTKYETAIGSSNTNKLTFVGGQDLIQASGQRIANIAAGTASTDAANVGQLITVTAGSNVSLKETANANGSTNYEISATGGGGGASYTSTDNIDVDNTAGTISLKDNIKLSNSGSIDIGAGTKIADGSLTVGTSSLTTSALKVGDLEYINESGINANNKTITNVATGQNPNDAAVVGQTVSEIEAGSINVYVEEEQQGDGSKKYKISVENSESGKPTVIAAGKNIAVTETIEGLQEVALTDNVALTDAGSLRVGNVDEASTGITSGGVKVTNKNDAASLTSGALTVTNGTDESSLTAEEFSVKGKTYIDANGINANSGKITNVAEGTEDNDAVNVAQLNAKVTSAAPKAGYNISVTQKDDGMEVALNDKVFLTSAGSLTVGTSELTNAALKVGGVEYINANGINAGSNNITNVAAGQSATDAANVGQLITVTAGSNVSLVESTNPNGSKNYEISAAGGGGGGGKIYTAGSNITFTGNDDIINLDDNVKLAESGSISVGENTYIDANGINANSYQIKNVAAGTTSYDAVNYEQLTAKTSGASAEAKSYTDTQIADALTTAGASIDGAVTEANGYTDTKVGAALATAGTSIDGAVTTAKNYTDQQVDTALASADLNGSENITVDKKNRTIELNDNIKLSDSGSLEIGKTSIDANGVKIGTNTALADETLTVGTSSLTTSALKVGDLEYINASGINANDKTITNVATGQNPNDAAVVGQTVSAVEAGSVNVYVAEETAGDGSKKYKISVENSSGEQTVIAAGKNISVTETIKGLQEVALDDNVALTDAGSMKVGTVNEVSTRITSGGVKVTNGADESSLTAEALTVGGKAYVGAAGINASDAKITNVAAGTASTDAANVSQLRTVSASRNITLVESTNPDGSKNYEISAIGGGTTYTSTDNIDVNNTAGTISLKDNIKLSDNGSIDIGSKTKIANGKLTVDGTTIDDSGVKVGTTTTLADGSLTVGTSSLTTSALKVGDLEYINSSGINANNKTITNLATGQYATDAAAVGQTVSKITAGKNVSVVESTAGDGSKEYEISVDGGGSGGKIYTAGNNIKLTGTDETVINLDDNIKLAENGSISVGNNTYIDANGLNANGKKITNVADGTADSDAVNVAQLNKTLSEAKDYTDNKVKEAFVSIDYNGTENIAVDNDNRTIALKENLTFGANADITIGTEENGTKIAQDGVTVTDGAEKAELTATGLKVNGKDTIDFKDNPEEGKATITNLAAGTDDTDAVTMQQLAGTEEEGTNIELKSVLTEKGEMKKVSLTDNVHLTEAGSITIGNKPSPMLRAAGGEYTEQTADSFTVSDGTNSAQLTATKLAVGKSEVTTDSLKIDGKEYINAAGINANDQKIINVANGTIAQNSKDAVNGGQLWDAYNRMSNIDNRMFDMDNRINDVYNDVSGVGSQAAAMSALQAIPYNPYAPTTVTAGLGFYRSDQAVAVGVYHYIRDTVLLNVGGAFNLNGHGDAMGRAGISFALGKGAGKGGQSIGRDVIAMQSKMDVMQNKINTLESENKENKQIIADNQKTIEENRKTIEENRKTIEKNEKTIEKNEKIMAENMKLIESLKKALEEKKK